MSISTHVLDTSKGRPAKGVPVTLERKGDDGAWSEIGRGETDADGRLKALVPEGTDLDARTYRIQFGTGAYFRSSGVEGFYPEATVVFEIRDASQHYHVPLLLSPFGYSTYRGS